MGTRYPQRRITLSTWQRANGRADSRLDLDWRLNVHTQSRFYLMINCKDLAAATLTSEDKEEEEEKGEPV